MTLKARDRIELPRVCSSRKRRASRWQRTELEIEGRGSWARRLLRIREDPWVA